MPDDKRSQPRYDAVIPVRFRDEQDFLIQYTQNISAGGVFIASNNPPPVGTKLRLSLELPGTRTAVPINGEVAYMISPSAASERAQVAGCGVRFLDVDPGTIQVFQQFVDNVERKTRGTVLVVDDDAEILEFLTDLLRGNRFTVVSSLSAVQATNLVKFNDFDVILSDLSMTRMDGFELRDILRQDPETRDIPFIILSASDDEEDSSVAASLGIRAFLRKPVKQEELVAAITSALVGDELKDTEPAPGSGKRAGIERINQIVYAKMMDLGMSPQFSADENTVNGTLRVSHVTLSHVVSGDPIRELTLANVGHDRVQATEPALLANLPPIPILDLEDAKGFELALERAYQRRVTWLEEGRTVLAKYGIDSELREASFSTVGRLRVDAFQVLLSARDESTLVVEAVNGRSFAEVAGPSACIVDISGADGSFDVEVAVEALVKQHTEALEQRVQAPAPAAAPEEEDEAPVSDLFGSMDDLLGMAPDDDEALALLDDDDLEFID